MAVIEGYTVPDTLEECQKALVVLLEEAKHRADLDAEKTRALTQAVNMIENARTALNAVEAPNQERKP